MIEPMGTRGHRGDTRKVWAWIAATAFIVGVLAGPAQSQDLNEAAERGLRVWKSTASCVRCHGWTGTGVRVEAEEGRGVNTDAPTLVETILERVDIIEAARCGRAASIMPRHDRNTWTEEKKCYGMTRQEFGAAVPFPDDPKRFLSDEQIDDVVTFVIEMYKSGPMSFEKCVFYWRREDAPQCRAFH